MRQMPSKNDPDNAVNAIKIKDLVRKEITDEFHRY